MVEPRDLYCCLVGHVLCSYLSLDFLDELQVRHLGKANLPVKHIDVDHNINKQFK